MARSAHPSHFGNIGLFLATISGSSSIDRFVQMALSSESFTCPLCALSRMTPDARRVQWRGRSFRELAASKSTATLAIIDMVFTQGPHGTNFTCGWQRSLALVQFHTSVQASFASFSAGVRMKPSVGPNTDSTMQLTLPTRCISRSQPTRSVTTPKSTGHGVTE